MKRASVGEHGVSVGEFLERVVAEGASAKCFTPKCQDVKKGNLRGNLRCLAPRLRRGSGLDPSGLRIYMRCVRCWKIDKKGNRTGDWKQTCSINDTEDPGYKSVSDTNDYPVSNGDIGNSSSSTPGDPYGENGPLEPGDYRLTRHPMGWRWGSPPVVTNHPTKPNHITTSSGTSRSGAMIHKQYTRSHGCITAVDGDFCDETERVIDESPTGDLPLEIVDAGDCPCPA